MFASVRLIWAGVRHHPISRHEPVRAFGRIVWWQLRRRLTGRPMRCQFVGGTQILVVPQRTSSTAVWYHGLPDPDEMLFAIHLLRPGDHFIDGGANVGVWSILAGSTGSDVVAVEPVPDTFAVLERQLAANRFVGTVRPLCAALSATEGRVRMTGERDAGNKIIEPGDVGIEVPTTTIDQVAANGATLIKHDLEGHELEALRGAMATLASPRLLALVIETFRWHNWAEPKLRAIEELLATAGFRPVSYDPRLRTMERMRGLETRPDESGNNTIYVRDLREVERRVQAAPPVRLGRHQW